MKQKDLMYLLLAVIIFLVAGYVGYTQLLPKKAASKTVQVEKIGTIPGAFDDTALNELNDPTKVADFDSPEDLTGLSNTSPFGQ